MGGYSLGQADLLRRAMGKKKKSEMEKHQELFVQGAEKNDVKAKVATDLWEKMVQFAEYCLSADTPILTVEYGAIAIGEIVQKQLACTVYSVDENGFVYTQAIAQWHDRGTQALVEYQLDDGTTLRATPDHKFMTTDGTMQPIDTIFEQGLDLLKVNAKIPVLV